MKREILYRQPIWVYNTKELKEWHYWGVGIVQGGEIANVAYMTYHNRVTDPNESQEFTGLLDKEKNKVFVGDIVSHHEGVFEIVFKNGSYKARMIVKGQTRRVAQIIGYGSWAKYSTVIGNTTEHAHLLTPNTEK